MVEMSWVQAISLVGQIESELTVLDQQRRALRRVADVLAKAREADDVLGSLVKQEAFYKQAIVDLEGRYATMNTTARGEHAQLLQELRAEEQNLKKKIAEAVGDLQKVEYTLGEARKKSAVAITSLDEQIAAKRMEYVKLVQDFTEFKSRHNLVGA